MGSSGAVVSSSGIGTGAVTTTGILDSTIANIDIDAAAAIGPTKIDGTAVVHSLADAKGDLLVASAADTITRLPVGTNDYVLTADSAQATGVKWAAISGGASLGANTFTAAQFIDGSADAVQLRVQGHSTQTSNLQTWESSSATVLASIDGSGVGSFASGTIIGALQIRAVSTRVGVGDGALASGSGAYMTGVGDHAGGQSTGQYNTALGGYSLWSNTSSQENTAAGYGALYYATGQKNTGVGGRVGYGITTGSYNTFLGFQAGHSDHGQTNVDGSVAIGCSSTGVGAVATASNEFVLGTSSHAVKVPGTLTTTGLLLTTASATGGANLRIPHGTAPTSPVDGDIWTTTAGLYVRINGGTVGPLS